MESIDLYCLEFKISNKQIKKEDIVKSVNGFKINLAQYLCKNAKSSICENAIIEPFMKYGKSKKHEIINVYFSAKEGQGLEEKLNKNELELLFHESLLENSKNHAMIDSKISLANSIKYKFDLYNSRVSHCEKTIRLPIMVSDYEDTKKIYILLKSLGTMVLGSISLMAYLTYFQK